MAVYKLFPLQDTTLYSFYPTMNTGIDPIIEVGNLNVNINPVPQVFRYLIQFDQSDINEVVDNKIKNTEFSSSLKTYISNAQGVIFDTELEVFPIGQVDGKVVVGQGGLIEGTINCNNADISGSLKVSITVKDLLTLKSSSNLVGDINTGKLQIEPGANFSGNCKMGAVVKGIESSSDRKQQEKSA